LKRYTKSVFVTWYHLRLKQLYSRLFKHCAASQVTACVKVLSFSLDTGPESFSPLVCRLSTMVCSKSAQTSTSRCFSWAKTCLVSCIRAPVYICSRKSTNHQTS